MKIKKILSLVLAVAMCVGMLSGLTLTANAKISAGNQELAREAAGEGMVLLKNESVGEAKALPLASTDTVALFGIGQIVHAKGYDGAGYNYPGYVPGGGGSAVVTSKQDVSPLDGLKNAVAAGKVGMDTTISDIYEAYKTNSDNAGEATEITAESIAAAKERGANTAVIVISRYSSEGTDRLASSKRGSYYLLAEEETLIENVKAAGFEKVVAILNWAGMSDSTWFKDDTGIDAALLVWLPGMEGGNAMWDILCGTVNPSGKLVDTLASSYDDYLSSANMKTSTVLYQEDIYVGYRQFETFDGHSDKVNYEFGFGLSYTDFTISDTTVSIDETKETDYGTGEVTVTAKVTNTGSVAGKEVVQVYVSAPQGELGKPSKELKGYAKTSLLEPNASETVTITFPLYFMSSYDDRGKTGNKSAYVLEAGDYNFYVGNSVRNNTNVHTYNVASTAVVTQLTEALTPVQDFEVYTADGTMEAVTAGTDTSAAPAYTKAEYTTTATEEIPFANVVSGKNTMEEFVAQMTTTELATLVTGYKTSAVGYSVPTVNFTDGPAGIRFGTPATLWPCGTLLACSFNDELVERVGVGFGQEMNDNGYHVVWGPSQNIHRNPLCGRNFEYLSEDPILSGKISAAMVRGLQSKDVGVTLKHFIANNQETLRTTQDSVATERALREIYLKGFEITVKEADPWGIMTSYNKINGEWSAHRYDLCTTIPRGEWGFDGYLTTDYNGEYDIVEMALAGNDYRLYGDTNRATDRTTLVDAVTDGTVTKAQLQEEAANILKLPLRTFAKNQVYSSAVVNIDDTVYTKLKMADFNTLSGGSKKTGDDYDGGKVVEISDDNAYLEFNINVETAGDYKIQFRSRCYVANAMTILLDDTEIGTVNHTGSSGAYTNRSAVTVTLPAGEHVLKFLVPTPDNFRVNYAIIAPVNAPVVEIGTDDTSTMFEAESAAELGGGANTEDCTDVGGGEQVINLQQEAYLVYNMNIASNTTKLISARIIRDDVAHLLENNGQFNVYLDDVLLGTITNYDDPVDYSFTDQLKVNLRAGLHTLKFAFSNGGMKMNYVSIDSPGTPKIAKNGSYLRLKAVDYVTVNRSEKEAAKGTNLYPSEYQINKFGQGAYVTFNVYVPASGYYALESTGQGFYDDAVIDVYVDDVKASTLDDGSLYVGGWGYMNSRYYKSNPLSMFLTKGYHTIKFQCDYSTDAFNMLFFDFAKTTYSISGITNAVDDGEYVYLYQADAEGVVLSAMPIASTKVSGGTYNFSLIRNGRYIVKAGDVSVNVTVADESVSADITK